MENNMKLYRNNPSRVDRFGESGYETIEGILTTDHATSSYGIPIFMLPDGTALSADELYNAGWGDALFSGKQELWDRFHALRTIRTEAENYARSQRTAEDAGWDGII
jgi:hypothetical protein